MKFGIQTPTCGEGLIYPAGFANHRTMVELSQNAERLGYDSTWGNDHISTQRYVKDLMAKPPNYFEPLITHAFISEATKKIRLGTGIIALPYRNPVILAKQLSTLDNLSKGRMIMGLGSGAYREEFEGINPGWDYEQRGVLMDEAVQALRLLLEKPKASFNGKFIKFADIEMFPKPKQKPFPLWMGGNSKAVLRRAGTWGEGWLPAVLTPEKVREGIRAIRKHAQRAGKDASRLVVGPQYVFLVAKHAEEASRKFKRSLAYEHLLSLRKTTFKGQDLEAYEKTNLIGSPTQIIERIDGLMKAGVNYLPALIPLASNYGQLMEQVKAFAREVMPSFS
ncbi:MAG: LLM class flavin-dependent oxidoreductase [Nitrososphaerota archaeon]|nr:LLM class flavin-dependent oxidoreductase [Nitrososphaerota archaeon]